jgi:hypothetical protein
MSDKIEVITTLHHANQLHTFDTVEQVNEFLSKKTYDSVKINNPADKIIAANTSTIPKGPIFITDNSMGNVFKIRLHAGLGDIFRMLSEHTSIELFYKTYGLTIYWVYAESKITPNDLMQQYLPDTDTITYRPLGVIIYDILSRVPFFKLVSQDEFESLNVPELNNWNDPQNKFILRGVFPDEKQGFQIPLTYTEQQELDNILSRSAKTICIQYSGRDSIKNYPVDSYVKLFRWLLVKYPDASILLIDRPDKIIDEQILNIDRNKIVSLIGKISRAQEVNLLLQVDYLICPCSYSKYVRRWVNGKQTVLANHYDYLDDTSVLNDVFGHYKYPWKTGLVYNPNCVILGAEYPKEEELEPNYIGFKSGQVKLIDHISNITPEEIFMSVNI